MPKLQIIGSPVVVCPKYDGAAEDFSRSGVGLAGYTFADYAEASPVRQDDMRAEGEAELFRRRASLAAQANASRPAAIASFSLGGVSSRL